MNNTSAKEILLAFLLLILLALLVNPFSFWMPSMLHVMILVGLVVVFALFSLFVLNERPSDEREQLHLMRASRIAYLTAGIVLVLGIAIQGFKDSLDPWLPAALTLMIIAKILTQAHSRVRH